MEAAADERPLVGVIMGSDSDLPTMAAACEMLTKFSIKFEVPRPCAASERSGTGCPC
eukprot:SAG31_NODE_5121_length_2727_cov_2.149924_2_plen_57_part_00